MTEEPAVLELELGEVLRLRKAHACGATDWTVVRLGADIGLRCTGCGRRILLSRTSLEQRLASRAGSEERSVPGEASDL